MAIKTVQGIKLVVRAPEQSYLERGMGGRKAIADGELYASRWHRHHNCSGMPQTQTQKEKELFARISDLESEIKKLKNKKKYGLVWEDKPEDVVLQCTENVPILKEVRSRKIAPGGSIWTNILIEGDNYHSLSVLNYTHKGKVDLIYIDPPYNTGNQSWRYNNDYIERDDSFRHSKWLSFMEKRLKLSKSLLKSEGIIIATIDDYEVYPLGLLMDEIFGEENKLASITVLNKKSGRTTDKFFATCHEYYLVYAKDATLANVGNFDVDQADLSEYKFEDEISRYRWRDFLRTGGFSTPAERPNSYYPIFFNEKTGEISIEKIKNAVEIFPIDSTAQKRVWRQTRPSLLNLIKIGDIKIEKNRSGKFSVRIRDRIKLEVKPKTVWDNPRYDAATHGTKLLESILGTAKTFDFPKSLYAVLDAVKIVTKNKKNATVLDFFAGSGTTGHAVLELNREDGGNRRFILCTNNENKICEEVTYERIKRVMKGYKNKKGEAVSGLGGNLSYYKTDLVNIDKLQKISDEAKVKISHQAGEMIALREDTLAEIERTDWWQIFEGNGKFTAIYFKEDKTKLPELIKLLEKKNAPVVLYAFSWGKNEYKNEYSTDHIRVEDIPEPIIEVYKEINRL